MNNIVKYSEILSKLQKSARFITEINEETVYFSGDKDLRLKRNEKRGVFNFERRKNS